MPNKVTFITILHACDSATAVTEGERIHTLIISRNLESDVIVQTALVHMYGKCCKLQQAKGIFDKMHDRNLISWNAIIDLYNQDGQDLEALQLLDQMLQEGVIPDRCTWLSILNGCANQANLLKGMQTHALVVASRLDLDVIVGTALMNVYGKCQHLNLAYKVFNELPERDVISWTSLIAACGQNRQITKAMQFFYQLQGEGLLPNKVTFLSILSACASRADLVEGEQIHAHIVCSEGGFDIVMRNALMNMYGKCGSLDGARRIFHEMPKNDVVSWNTMIKVYSQHGQTADALHLFQCMQLEGIRPDKVTFINILSACSHTGLLHDAQYYFISMKQEYGITPMPDHYNCMIDLFGRAGRLVEAEDLIHNMPCEPSIASFMTFLCACRHQIDVGRGERAANNMFNLHPESAAPYVMLSNIYAAAGRSNDAAKVISRMIEKGMKKPQGCSSVMLKARCTFHIHDHWQPQKGEMNSEFRLSAGNSPEAIAVAV